MRCPQELPTSSSRSLSFSQQLYGGEQISYKGPTRSQPFNTRTDSCILLLSSSSVCVISTISLHKDKYRKQQLRISAKMPCRTDTMLHTSPSIHKVLKVKVKAVIEYNHCIQICMVILTKIPCQALPQYSGVFCFVWITSTVCGKS